MKTLRARSVLADCRWALAQYSSELSGPRLRVAWVGIVTLLRAVGHVLKKVDARDDPKIRQIVDQLWNEWASTKPAIFSEFIENERNSVLKQYEFGFSRTFEARRTEEGPVTIDLRGDLLARAESNELPQVALRGLQSIILDGPFHGRPESGVAAEAIEWWELQLTQIERRAGLRETS
jgi:hypothetical protein